jgi:hypothetical protein
MTEDKKGDQEKMKCKKARSNLKLVITLLF